MTTLNMSTLNDHPKYDHLNEYPKYDHPKWVP